MLSLPCKGPYCLASIYSDLLLVKAIFSSVQNLLHGILEVGPFYHMIWSSVMMIDCSYPLFTDQIQLFISNFYPSHLL
jgi:hypothetical protein